MRLIAGWIAWTVAISWMAVAHAQYLEPPHRPADWKERSVPDFIKEAGWTEGTGPVNMQDEIAAKRVVVDSEGRLTLLDEGQSSDDKPLTQEDYDGWQRPAMQSAT